MKFEKHVKNLASSGVIYERDGSERWLASPTAFMLIPPGTRSVTAVSISPMPQNIDKMIDQIGHTEDAFLSRAVMPVADGKIKDCIRIFATPSGDITIPICNDDWSLIEKSDMTHVLYAYDIDSNTYTAKALLVKNYPDIPSDDPELVGIIFPVNIEI